MGEQARVVVIGGGAVGCSCLYHLAKAGWTDCLLLERDELTSGSTWHAAGNCPTFAGSWNIIKYQRYSADLYRGLAEALDYPINYPVIITHSNLLTLVCFYIWSSSDIRINVGRTCATIYCNILRPFNIIF